jgi:branched-chain amino acid transport system substrate-binding protein
MREEKKMKGRRFILLIGAAVILGIGIAGAQTPAKGPIKVGLLFPATGPFAVQGPPMTNAAKQLFEEKGLQVAGRKIVLFSEDTEAKPDVGLTKTKKVVELDKVNVINGYISTAVSYAVRDYLHQMGVPAVIAPSGAGHTRKLFSPYVFRVPPSTYQYY